MKYLITIFIFLSSIFLSASHAQTDTIATAKLFSFVRNVGTFNRLYPQEKVYLHFDNTGYYLGETIWFKAYVVDASNLRFTGLSKILYVELLTREGECIQARKLKIENGQCHGDFALNPELRSGFYEVRAYTRCMLNFGDECVFSRVFPVYQTPEKEGNYTDKDMSDANSQQTTRKVEKETAKKRKSVNIDFYPEGGNVVKGLPNRIAFKATGKNGEDISVTGRVIGRDKQTISTFSTSHRGMGILGLHPTEEKRRVEITYGNDTYLLDLPEVLPFGYAVSISNLRDDSLDVLVRRTPDLPVETLGLAISCRGRVCLFRAIKADSDSLVQAVSKKALPAGVNSLTLFRQSGEILCERLFFVNRACGVSLSCTANKERYKPLEKIRLKLIARNDGSDPVAATVSLSVRDAASCGVSAYAENIQTNLLLESDLRGYIEQPGYYFASDDVEHRQALDLLLMTQGWRRYSWKRMSGLEPFDITHPIEESLMIKGKVLKPLTSGALGGVRLKYLLSGKDAPQRSAYGDTWEDGTFAFLLNDSLNIRSRWDLMLSVSREGNPVKCRVLLDRQFSPQVKVYSNYETVDNDTILRFNDVREDAVKARRSITDVQHLNEVSVTASKRRKIKPSVIYHVDKEINDLADKGEFYARTVGVYLEDKDPQFHIFDTGWFYGDLDVMAGYSNNKGIYRKDGDQMEEFNISSIKDIYVYRNPKVWRDIAEGKVLSYILKFDRNNPEKNGRYVYVYAIMKQDKSFKEIPDGTRLTYFEGYSNIREFAKTVLREPVPGVEDHRRTLYWNPDISINAEGKASVEFFNNSSCKHILVDCEGVTGKGVPMLYDKLNNNSTK